ncbi:hypothetical protein EG329_008400 [Mollisiaceae sp. DMI_Dod_QoI]|nr:hypothetical protein EG329_008400 [Helotiales sp. DMI_Dod_QoI]
MRTSLRRNQQLLHTSTPSSRHSFTTARSREFPAPKPICQTCHRPLVPSRLQPQPQKQRRLYSSSSASTSQSQAQEQTTPPTPPIPKTHYDLFPRTLPRGPPPAGSFYIDVRQLRKEFLLLQSKAHPDLFPPHLKSRAEATSSLINTAYKTLQSPLLRAQYLLGLQGIETAEDETAKVEDPTLLMEVLEAREAIESAEEEGHLDGVRAENEERIRETEQALGERFEAGDLEGARRECVRLRYWVNVRESIEGWEKGKGGGAIHH